VETALNAAMRQGEVGAVMIVSPTYHGVVSDVAAIAQVCHAHGVPLIVDEAHGSHFAFSGRLPAAALDRGADVAIQSTHKTLGALSQASMLHLRGSLVPRPALASALRLLHSSSPSAVLLASLDAARHQIMSTAGRTMLEAAIDLALSARLRLAAIPGIQVFTRDSLRSSSEASRGAVDAEDAAGVDLDAMRVTVRVDGLRLHGLSTEALLNQRYGVFPELATHKALAFVVTIGTTQRDIDALVSAFADVSARTVALHGCGVDVDSSGDGDKRCWQDVWSACEQVMAPRDAYMSAPPHVLPLADAVGRIACEVVCPYPPGIPVLVPGQRITQHAVDLLRDVICVGGYVSGCTDTSMSSLLVVRDEHVRTSNFS